MSKITPTTEQNRLGTVNLFSKGDIYRHYNIDGERTAVTKGIITSYTGHVMTPYELRCLTGPHTGTRLQVSHDIITTRTSKPNETNKEEQAFNNTITWKLFQETGDQPQKAYSRQPVLNKVTRVVELDRIYEDTDTETDTLIDVIINREFHKPDKTMKSRGNDGLTAHIQQVTRGRKPTRTSHKSCREHAPVRLLIEAKANTSTPCDCDKQDTPDDIKAAFAVHCVFDLAQTETKGEQIWVPGRAIPGSGSGDAGVG